MAILTPILYQSIAERYGGPQLLPHLIEGFAERTAYLDFPRLSPGDLFRLASYRVEPLLRPVSLTDAAAGAVGVPLIEDSELPDLLGDAEAGDREPESRGGWWEFWRTETGQWAMFPGNYNPGWQVAVLLPIRTSTGIQLRMLQRELAFEPDRTEIGPTGPAVAVAPTGCVPEMTQDEPGAPYRGRCENVGCPGPCSAQVVLTPDDGIHRLMGCGC